MNTDRKMLALEVGFWNELIKRRGETASPESLERMQQALELAQLRLLEYSDPAVEREIRQ